MAGFDDAALGVVHQDGEPSAAETIDAGDPRGFHLKSDCPFFVLLFCSIKTDAFYVVFLARLLACKTVKPMTSSPSYRTITSSSVISLSVA